jgi:hypothetical protein
LKNIKAATSKSAAFFIFNAPLPSTAFISIVTAQIIFAPGRPLLEEEFELTDSFTWLKENAHQFDFRLSYPRGNDLGIIYEPWHWFYTGPVIVPKKNP